jgi:hypothetical protein
MKTEAGEGGDTGQINDHTRPCLSFKGQASLFKLQANERLKRQPFKFAYGWD